jgi:cytochrome P450
MRKEDRAAAFPLGASLSVERLQREPYPVFAELREREPVSWIDALGVWFVTRHSDVLGVIGNPNTFSNKSSHSLIFETFGEQMLSIEGATHRRYKSKMRPPFIPRSVRQSLEPAIEPIVNRLIGDFASDGHTELRASFASRLPIRMMLEVFGLPLETEISLRKWYDSFEAALSNFEHDPAIKVVARDNVDEFKQLLQDQMNRVRETPDASLLSTLVNSAEEDRLSDEEIKRNSLIVFFGGISTVEALILNTLWSLIVHPESLDAVQRDKNLIPIAIEETLRWRSPVQSATRHVTESCGFKGVYFEKGDVVNCMLGAANRDPDVFESPEAFDIHRPNLNDHLGFATGLHFCLGFHLARTEARIAIEQLLHRLPGLQLACGESVTPVGYEFHQPNALPLTW